MTDQRQPRRNEARHAIAIQFSIGMSGNVYVYAHHPQILLDAVKLPVQLWEEVRPHPWPVRNGLGILIHNMFIPQLITSVMPRISPMGPLGRRG